MYHLIFIIPYFIILLFQFGKYRSFTPLSVLLLIAIFSNISCLIIYPEFQIETFDEFQITLYTYIILSSILIPFYLFNGVRSIKTISQKKLTKLCRFVYFFGSIGFILTLLTGIISIFIFNSISANVAEYKNGGIADELLQQVLPDFIFTIMGFTSAFALVALALHFYFLSQNQFKKSIYPLFISLTLPLGALQELSRGRIIMYLGLYLMTYLYLKKAIPTPNLRRLNKYIRITLIPLSFVFIFISVDRFSDNKYNEYESNPVINSLLDYAGQWHKNSLEVINDYDDSKNMSGSRFKYLSRRVSRFFGETPIEQFELDIIVYGKLGTRFRGLVSNLVYDLGYFGSLIFVILLMFLYGIARPNRKKELGFEQIIYFIFFSLFALFFFQGNILVLSFFSFSILIAIFLNIYLKFRWQYYLFIKTRINNIIQNLLQVKFN